MAVHTVKQSATDATRFEMVYDRRPVMDKENILGHPSIRSPVKPLSNESVSYVKQRDVGLLKSKIKKKCIDRNRLEIFEKRKKGKRFCKSSYDLTKLFKIIV